MNFLSMLEEESQTAGLLSTNAANTNHNDHHHHNNADSGERSPTLQAHLQVQNNARDLAMTHWRLIFFWFSLIFNIVQLVLTLIVLAVTQSAACDQPLKSFLALYSAAIVGHISVIVWHYRAWDESASPDFWLDDGFGTGNSDANGGDWGREAATELSNVFTLMTYVLGNLWVFNCDTCPKTAPALFYLSLTWVIYGYVILLLPLVLLMLIIFCLPLFILFMRLFYPQERRGATDALIQTLPFYAFKQPGDAYGPIVVSKEDAECAICLAPYEREQCLRVFGCQHHFHQECVDRWLAISATCPLCVQPVFSAHERRHHRPPPLIDNIGAPSSAGLTIVPIEDDAAMPLVR
jgi:hypothetical protein